MKSEIDNNLLIDIFSLPVKAKRARKQRMDKGFTHAQICKLRTQFKDIISDVSDERDSEDGVWFYFVEGYSADQIHCVHEWNYQDALNGLKRVKPCYCQDCQLVRVALGEAEAHLND